MRRAGTFPRLRVIAGIGAALLLVLVVTLSARSFRAMPSAPPQALERIAEKNRKAAAVAAARQRAESAASTNAADNLVAAQERGSAEADAMLTRVQDQEDGNATATAR